MSPFVRNLVPASPRTCARWYDESPAEPTGDPHVPFPTPPPRSLLFFHWLCATREPDNVVCKATPPSAPTEASRAYARGDFARAEALYDAQRTSAPTEAAFAGLVDSQLQQDKVDQAIATAKSAVAALPNSAEALAVLGDAQFRASHLDDARDAFVAARKLDSCSARAHFGVARVLELSSMHASAQKELIVAHKLAVTNSYISEALFATLPPQMHAKGFRNLLASTPDMAADRHQRLEQEATLLEAGTACIAQNPITQLTKIELTPVQYSGTALRDWSVRTSFGDKKTNLEIDSTAPGIVLSESEAARLGVVPAIASQNKAPYLGSVDHLQVAGMNFARCLVHVLPDVQLPHGQAVIGTDFFRDSLISFNWPGRFMTLAPYPSPAGTTPTDATIPESEKGWSHVLIDEHRILLATAINKELTGVFLYDTAYTPTIIAPAAAARLHPQADGSADVEGVSGTLVRFFYKDGGGATDRSDMLDSKGHLINLMRPAVFTTFRFAGNEYPDKNTYTFDMTAASHAAGLELSGIFGYTVMREYFTDIDYRNGLMHLKYDPNFYLRTGSPVH